MKKIIYALYFLIVVPFSVFSQNVGISATGATPATSAMLDIVSSNSGLLIPRVGLVSITDVVTIPGPAVSLLVYNNGTGGLSTTGYYYWNGSKWVLFGTTATDWLLTGNAGTTVGTNFLGTTDDVDLQFNVNNQRSGLIDHANFQTFLGYQAGLNSLSTGNLTTFIGYQSGNVNTSGNANTALGFAALKNNSTANDNTAVGVDALVYAVGTGNTGVGSHVLEGTTTPASNTGIYNTALGFAAGSGYSGTPNNLPFSTGSYNTFLGYNTTITPGTLNNATAIGANAQVTTNNAIILGGINGVNTATVATNVGIGTTAPDAAALLEIKSTTAGVLLPRVSLTSTALFSPLSPLSSSVTPGFLVYNVNTNTTTATTAVYANNYYFWDGTKWNIFSYSTPSGTTNYNTIGLNNSTVGAGTYVVPAGVTKIKVVLVGGSGSSGTSSGGGAGGDAGMVWGVLAVTPGETLNMIVGTGGASIRAGGTGSSVSRGATLLCAAGGGGGGSTNTGANSAGGSGGAAFGISINGGNGNTAATGGTSGNNYISYLTESEAFYGMYIATSYTYFNVGSPAGTAGMGSSATSYTGTGNKGFILIYY